jgi:transposase
MAKERWKLTNEQWKKIEKLLPKSKKSKKGGRHWADNRKVFEGILWILRTRAPWADLLKRYPSPSACCRRLKLWEEQDIWLDAWRAFQSELDEKGQLDWSEAFVDGGFAPAKKGRMRRQDQEGQRHEVDGGGRRPRYSSWKPLGLCVPLGGRAPRENAE